MEESKSDVRCVMNTRTQKMWIEKDGIVRCICFVGVDQDEDDAKENFKTFQALIGNLKEVPMLIDMTGVKSCSRGYNEYLALCSREKKIGPQALIIKSKFKKEFINFLYRLKRPRQSMRLFTSESEARKWIRVKRGL